MDLVLDEQGNLLGGPIHEIVTHLMSWEYKSADDFKRKVRALLFAFRSACTVSDLLELMQQVLQDVMGDEIDSKDFDLVGVRARLQFFLREWLRVGFHSDFEGKVELCEKMEGLTGEIFPPDEAMELLGQFQSLADEATLPELPPAIEEELVDRGVFMESSLLVLKRDAKQVAYALSGFYRLVYTQLKPNELVNKNWQRTQAETLSPRVKFLTKHFNLVAFWAASCVCLAYTKESQREIYHKLLDVAWELRVINNLMGMGAFVSGLVNMNVSRLEYLKGSLKKAQLEKLAEMEDILSPKSNYTRYRKMLEDLEGQPCIPYLPCHLRDLLIIHEREPDWLESVSSERLANFTKMVALGDSMYQLMRFQSCEWPYAPNDSTILHDFMQLQFLDEEALYTWSSQWKTEVGLNSSLPEMPSFSLVRFKAPVHAGHVLLRVMFQNRLVSVPLSVLVRWKDLRALCCAIAGNSSKTKITSAESGAEIFDQATTMGFLSAHEDLTLNVELGSKKHSLAETTGKSKKSARRRLSRPDMSPWTFNIRSDSETAILTPQMRRVAEKESKLIDMRSSKSCKVSPLSSDDEGELDTLPRGASTEKVLKTLHKYLIIKDHRRGLRKHSSCFKGLDAVTLVALYHKVSHTQATEMCSQLFDEMLIQHVTGEKRFRDDKSLYRFTSAAEERRVGSHKHKGTKLLSIDVLFAVSLQVVKLTVLASITLQEFRVLLALLGCEKARVFETEDIEIVEPYHFSALLKDGRQFIVHVK